MSIQTWMVLNGKGIKTNESHKLSPQNVISNSIKNIFELLFGGLTRVTFSGAERTV